VSGDARPSRCGSVAHLVQRGNADTDELLARNAGQSSRPLDTGWRLLVGGSTSHAESQTALFCLCKSRAIPESSDPAHPPRGHPLLSFLRRQSPSGFVSRAQASGRFTGDDPVMSKLEELPGQLRAVKAQVEELLSQGGPTVDPDGGRQ